MEISLCEHCKHYLFDLKCMAFPVRIPDKILEGKNNHSKPLPGQDNDIVFEDIHEDGQLINFKLKKMK